MIRRRADRVGSVAVGVAILAACVASVYLTRAPMYEGFGTTVDNLGVRTESPLGSQTLVEVNGARVYLILLVPIVLTCLPLLLSRSRARILGTWFAASALAVFCVMGAWTIGMFYVPAAVVLLLAAVLWTIGRQVTST